MIAIKKEPSGQGHHFAIGEERFGASVEIRGISALGDALVGARRWDSRSVIRERDLVLGQDDMKAREFVNDVRKKMIGAWKECFYQVVNAETEEFGENSYFRSTRGLARLAKLEQLK